MYVDEILLKEDAKKREAQKKEDERKARLAAIEEAKKLKPPPLAQLEASKTIFEEVMRVMYAVVACNPAKNLKVKRLAIYQMLPHIVNLSKPFMQP